MVPWLLAAIISRSTHFNDFAKADSEDWVCQRVADLGDMVHCVTSCDLGATYHPRYVRRGNIEDHTRRRAAVEGTYHGTSEQA